MGVRSWRVMIEGDGWWGWSLELVTEEGGGNIIIEGWEEGWEEGWQEGSRASMNHQ